ncbi:hypothetical protein ACFL42_01685 [Candidatus Omnitrophota bacterium]
MARDNYSFIKRKKELARKKKKEDKRQQKLARKNMQLKESETQASNEDPGQSPDGNAAPL